MSSSLSRIVDSYLDTISPRLKLMQAEVADNSRKGAGGVVVNNNYSESNAHFAKNNALFRRACELAKVEPTARQASKWRNQRGRAYAMRNAAVKEAS